MNHMTTVQTTTIDDIHTLRDLTFNTRLFFGTYRQDQMDILLSYAALFATETPAEK